MMNYRDVDVGVSRLKRGKVGAMTVMVQDDIKGRVVVTGESKSLACGAGAEQQRQIAAN
jgi:hypothetical protein